MHGGPQLSRLKKKPHNKKNKTFSLCRAVFSFCREVFSFAVRFFLLPWGFFFRHEVFSFATRLFLLPRGNYLCSDSWGPLYKCEAKRSVRSWGKNKRKFAKKKAHPWVPNRTHILIHLHGTVREKWLKQFSKVLLHTFKGPQSLYVPAYKIKEAESL